MEGISQFHTADGRDANNYVNKSIFSIKVSVYPKIEHFSKKLFFAFSDRLYYDLSFKKIL